MNIYKQIKHTFRRIKRIIEFIPTLWNGYDFDYSSSIDLFAYQLERTAKMLNSKNAYGMDSKNTAKRCMMVCKLMKKVYDDDYALEYMGVMEKTYGKSEIIFTELPNKYYKFDGFKWENAVSKQHNDEINDIRRKLSSLAEAKQKRAEILLWKLVAHNIRNFWD